MFLLQLILYGLFLMFNAQQITKSTFSCDGRVSGYYADVGTGCQVYHMCDGLGRKFSFACPNATLFQQRMLICDHWFMVNCSKSESEYRTNLLIGQKEKPFVEDSNGQSSFQRTPRPDYASGSSVKNDQIDLSEETNLVGVNSDENQNRGTGYNLPSRWSTEYDKIKPTADPKNQISRRDYQETNEQAQNMKKVEIVQNQNEQVNPSEQTESIEDRLNHGFEPEFQINFESNYKATTPVYPKYVDDETKYKNFEIAPPRIQTVKEINELQSPEVHVNFESDFNATTPVYPKFVDETLKLKNIELEPPKGTFDEPQKETTVHINFESNFKATTPVYPSSVDEILKLNNLELFPPLQENDEKNDVKVNFVSDFKATTPVYPLSVDSTSPNPDNVGLLPPLDSAPVVNKIDITTSTPKVPVNFQSNFLATVPNYPASVEATSPLPDEVGLLPPIRIANARFLNYNRNSADSPSQNYEPPLYDVGYVDPNGALASIRRSDTHVLEPKIEDWNELRKKFSVPDYEFPLDSSAHRTSYESDLSSFQPRPGGLQRR